MKQFPGKILIFGEYLVLDHHVGLATPLASTYCSLHKQKAQNPKVSEGISIRELMDNWISYCVKHRLNFLDLKRWQNDVKETLSIDSNIPIGYGLGSSGAITACIYADYGEYTKDQKETRLRLAQMESFFHGKSSGIDPWVSYSKQSWLFQGKELRAVDEDKVSDFTTKCVLIDSGIPRNTKLLVERFQEERKQMEGWQEMVDLSNALAKSFLHLETPTDIQESIHRLSTLQRENMSWLIPETLQAFWDQVLASGNAMKLCGAGGGGYFLLYDPGRQLKPLIAEHSLTFKTL